MPDAFPTVPPGARPRLVSVSKYVPYRGIPHAGGQYLVQHYRALARRFDVEVVSPSTPLNRDALEQPRDSVARVDLLPGKGPFRHGRFKLMADVDSVLRGSSATADVVAEFRWNRRLRAELADARLVEFQWTEMAALAPVVRRIAPQARTVFVAHDVITQRWRRRAAEASSPLVRSAYSAAAWRSLDRERRSMLAVDRVIVFSEKDAEIAVDIAPTARVEVVPPGLGQAEPGTAPPPAQPRSARPTVLFTGAMNRPDNHEGVLWFLEAVWPDVCELAPNARFVIAGADPPQRLRQRAEEFTNVELTGYVDSLEPYYAAADVMVVPLFTGAGVKFKTIDAMLRGIPVVSTPVGAEGLGDPSLYVDVTTDAGAFARAVVETIADPESAPTARAREWASLRFGFEGFAERLTTVYEQLMDGGGR
jgi:glycosyltransferase involved in cell wall biosynthesis